MSFKEAFEQSATKILAKHFGIQEDEVSLEHWQFLNQQLVRVFAFDTLSKDSYDELSRQELTQIPEIKSP